MATMIAKGANIKRRSRVSFANALRTTRSTSAQKPGSFSLPIVQRRLRCGFAHFELSANLLDFCILLCQPLVYCAKGCFQFFHFAMLFEELVEQHRVHRVVA